MPFDIPAWQKALDNVQPGGDALDVVNGLPAPAPACPRCGKSLTEDGVHTCSPQKPSLGDAPPLPCPTCGGAAACWCKPESAPLGEPRDERKTLCGKDGRLYRIGESGGLEREDGERPGVFYEVISPRLAYMVHLLHEQALSAPLAADRGERHEWKVLDGEETEGGLVWSGCTCGTQFDFKRDQEVHAVEALRAALVGATEETKLAEEHLHDALESLADAQGETEQVRQSLLQTTKNLQAELENVVALQQEIARLREELRIEHAHRMEDLEDLNTATDAVIEAEKKLEGSHAAGRSAGIEDAAKAMCRHCEEGVDRDEHGNHRVQDQSIVSAKSYYIAVCKASRVRALLESEGAPT